MPFAKATPRSIHHLRRHWSFSIPTNSLGLALVITNPDLRLLIIQVGKMVAWPSETVKVPVKRFTVKLRS